MVLPKVLIDQIRMGRVILFLGAGAAKGASHPAGASPPDGKRLAQMLAEKYLGPEFLDRPLDQVASLAISEASLFELQNHIRDIFTLFDPAEFHLAVPTFSWRAIATTNYDLIVERAYAAQAARAQNLVPFFKDGQRVDDRLTVPNNTAYLKLHGCISNTEDESCPLILTPEQYVDHEDGRRRLFRRLEDLAHEAPLLFVGHSLGDLDLRAILLRLSKLGDTIPRSYVVAPHVTTIDARFWETRRITSIELTFEQFLAKLETEIPQPLRKLAAFVDNTTHPIQHHFARNEPLSEGLVAFLENQVEFVHSALPISTADPALFYKGYFSDWSPIVNQLDVRRGITDTILTDSVLVAEGERRHTQEFVLIFGHAGSGKSVTLHRLAWDAATEFDCLCLFQRDGALCEFDRLLEVYESTRKRVYLFVDNAVLHRDNLMDIVTRARRNRMPLTIFATARDNEWTAHCEALDMLVTTDHQLRYLNESEVEALVDLLTKHGSLNHLEGLDRAQQIRALQYTAGRQLLVALHEATLGKPFGDIILDEYKSIPSPRAQALYRTICVLHRTGVPVRAGLMSRVHGITLSTFREQLFQPLSNIVFAKPQSLTRDFAYTTRHRRIAELVFERVLTDPSERLAEYENILSKLDVDFTADRESQRALISAREVSALFPEISMARRVYAAATSAAPKESAILQQEAVMEMNHAHGDIARAEKLLLAAAHLAPKNAAIQHSLAELNLRKAQRSNVPLERQQFRRVARQYLAGIGRAKPHTQHTLLKIQFDEVREALDSGDKAAFSDKVREMEEDVAQARSDFPDDSHIGDIDAQLSELLGRTPAAVAALEAAFASHASSAYIAMRLAEVLCREGKDQRGLDVLRQCLDENPDNKDLHYRLAAILFRVEGESASVRHHLRHSFTRGDGRIQPQFRYARAEFIGGDRGLALEIFEDLGRLPLANSARHEPRSPIASDGTITRFSGSMTQREASYGFVVRDGDQQRFFTRPEWSGSFDWETAQRHARVIFSIAFNFRGPVAMDLAYEVAPT